MSPEEELVQLRALNSQLSARNSELVVENLRLRGDLEAVQQVLGASEAERADLANSLNRERHDELTNAPLRNLFKQRTDALIDGSRGSELVHCFFIDVRKMKIINDTLGHEAADLLLQDIGRAGIETPGSGFTFGRWGGDEFVMVLRGGTTSEARALYENFKDRAFQHFTETVAKNWKLFQPTGQTAKPNGDDARRVAARWFRLTPGLKSVPVDRSRPVATTRDFMIKEADKEMYKVKLLQQLGDVKAEVNSQIRLAKQSGIQIEPSQTWLEENLTRGSQAERRFQGLVRQNTDYAVEVGELLLNENPPWVQTLVGNVNREELDATSRIALCLDLALVAEARSDRDVIEPTVVFKQEIYLREPHISKMVETMQSHDYRSPVVRRAAADQPESAVYPRSALGQAVPTVGAEMGYAATGAPSIKTGALGL